MYNLISKSDLSEPVYMNDIAKTISIHNYGIPVQIELSLQENIRYCSHFIVFCMINELCIRLYIHHKNQHS